MQDRLRALREREPKRVMERPDGTLALAPNVRVKSHRSHAAKVARRQTPQPEQCEECGHATKKLQAHHVVPYATLKQQGVHHDPTQHVFRWLCGPCHITAHQGEPVTRLMQKAERE